MTAAMSRTTTEFGKVALQPVDRLQLDRRNPRLIDQTAEVSDTALIAQLFRGSELDELLQSISANGYLDIEPLVAMPMSGDGKEHFIVLEGNRRLAALRLLREPELVEAIKASESLSIAIPPVDQNLRSTFDQVSVYCVECREAARAFIGFKHINGPAKWDAYAKARFAADWYRQAGGRDLNSIARSIGDGHATIKRMVSAIYVLDQAQAKHLFDINDRVTPKFNFSHLYTALSRVQYVQYLGIDENWTRYDPQRDPVPTDRLGALKQVLVWIYGSREENLRPAVRTQNPDIKRLGEVLADPEGLRVLEANADLDAAYAAIEPVDRRLSASLVRARDNINDAAKSLRGFDGRETSLLDIAGDVKEVSETVYERMQKKTREAVTVE